MTLLRLLFAKHPTLTLVFAVIALVGIEAALQMRAQLKMGRSVFTQVFAEPTKVQDPELGFQTFRANARIGGGAQVIETNLLGFRSPQLADGPGDEVLRIAFVGASTVFGAYAPRNEALMSYRVAEGLRRLPGMAEVELFNAGLPGRTLEQQLTILKRRVLPWQPNIVIFYTGMIDVSAVCRQSPGDTSDGKADSAIQAGLDVPQPALPDWLLSTELIRKNTLFLRPQTGGSATGPSARPADVPFDQLRRRVDALLAETRSAGAIPVVATLTRAFRPEQPQEVQRALSTSIRYYYDCFDLAGLNANFSAYNAMLRAAARDAGAPLVDLAKAIPGGRTHFADATHFSPAGEALAAETILPVLRRVIRARGLTNPADTVDRRSPEE